MLRKSTLLAFLLIIVSVSTGWAQQEKEIHFDTGWGVFYPPLTEGASSIPFVRLGYITPNQWMFSVEASKSSIKRTSGDLSSLNGRSRLWSFLNFSVMLGKRKQLNENQWVVGNIGFIHSRTEYVGVFVDNWSSNGNSHLQTQIGDQDLNYNGLSLGIQYYYAINSQLKVGVTSNFYYYNMETDPLGWVLSPSISITI
ncbi:MAG: hypothetical protein ACQETE_03855 [Bacteroidota bacterium]